MKIRSLLEIKRRHLGFICLCVIAVILFAGLWPFDANPVNRVERLQNSNGIRFYGQGIIFSAEPIIIHDTTETNAAVTIELLIRPHKGKGNRPIITIHDREQDQLIIGQWKKEFYIRVPAINNDYQKRYRVIGLENALEEDTTHLMSVTSGNGITKIYIDGALMRSFPNFSLVPYGQGLSGQLILGNSPTGTHTWNGTFLGLAIYDQTLDNKEVLKNYQSWHTFGRPLISTGKKPTVLYLFDEHAGDQIRDHSGSGKNLLLSATFHPIRRTIFGMPHKNQLFKNSNLLDVSINILGFVPFGFFFSAWLRQSKNLCAPHLYSISIISGFCVSIAIELAQAYLPTRDSSLLDVFNNVLGTVVGVFLLKFIASILHKSQ